MKKILIIEDDEIIANIIQYYLSKNGLYHTEWAKNAGEALIMIENNPDVILLDICLPDVNGVKLCARLRESIYCPIIFISCLDDEETIVKALETGGDDYITKPFSEKILTSHIEANLRRVWLDHSIENKKQKSSLIHFEDFDVNCQNHSIIRNSDIYHIAPIEYSILMYFVNNPNRIISPDELYENIWGKPGFGDVRTVVTHVYNLRKIIEDDCSSPKYISNVRGSGYLFCIDTK